MVHISYVPHNVVCLYEQMFHCGVFCASNDLSVLPYSEAGVVCLVLVVNFVAALYSRLFHVF